MKEMEDVLNKIKEIAHLSKLKIEDFACEDGYAHIVAKHMRKEEMKITQLRKFFSAIKQIEKKQKGRKPTDNLDMAEVYPLYIELAYAYGRKLITKEFYRLMKDCFSKEKLHTVEDFQRLVKFLEAIIAYHKMEEKKG